MRRARQLKGDSKAAVYVRNEGAKLPLREMQLAAEPFWAGCVRLHSHWRMLWKPIRYGGKWADCGSSAFLHHEAETDIAEACIYRSLRSRVRIVSRSLSHGRYEPFSRL